MDFFRFLDGLPGLGGDPWQLYEDCYLAPHREVLTSWWEQCMGRSRDVWQERVRAVRPEDYGTLRILVSETDLAEAAREAMARCQEVAPLSPEPEIYFLVGFFSPDGFAFEVKGRWAMGIGMERITAPRSIPVLLAHEYMHCWRNRLRRPTNLGERMVEEGFAVEMAARVFPERPAREHLMVGRGQLAAFAEYEEELWEAVRPLLCSQDEALSARILYGRARRGEWPSRAGMYLGWRLVQDFLETARGGFEAAPEQMLQPLRDAGWRRPRCSRAR
jgi:hypothetical protein